MLIPVRARKFCTPDFSSPSTMLNLSYHARLRFTYIFDARMDDYTATHLTVPLVKPRRFTSNPGSAAIGRWYSRGVEGLCCASSTYGSAASAAAERWDAAFARAMPGREGGVRMLIPPADGLIAPLAFPAAGYGLFPYNPYFRNHARLRFTYIFDSRITDYMETHP